MHKVSYKESGSITVEFVFVLLPVFLTVFFLIVMTVQTVERDMIRYATIVAAREARDFQGHANPSLYKTEFTKKFMYAIEDLPLVSKQITDYTFNVQGFRNTQSLLSDQHMDISACTNCLFAAYSVSADAPFFGFGSFVNSQIKSSIIMGQEHEGW
ncbi:TadE/TadG family type IV pilus assembly protein [Vibrio mediterranei]|uniref:TadE/TadG family type IV pilus assembly protein n=1 Tax=Vibrio mediterranei TaxID=689 RepID=UPI00148C4B2C|nr:TadE family protein [Vibrio mediterranei]